MRRSVAARAAAWAIAAAVACAPAAVLAAPPAGTAIDNVALASGFSAGLPFGIGSNTVTTIVQPLAAMALTRSQADTVPAGATVTLRHRLANLGNATTAFRLDVANHAADDYDFAPLSLIHDLDRDGVAGGGDPGIPSGGIVTLAAGDSADLLVLAAVPTSAPSGGAARLELTAGDGAGLTAANTDTVVVAGPPPAVLTLVVEQTASRSFVEVGDELDYTVRVANRSDSSLAAVILSDALPAGFAYVPASASRDGARLAEPTGGRGPLLGFAIGPLGAGDLATIRFRARVGPGSPVGDAMNTTWADAADVRSNVATTRVTVDAGVFSDEGTIVGTVYIDRDGDRRRGIGDAGIPGVRIYLDDGSFAVTDGDGQYSLYGVTPRTHALRPDPATLPLEVRLIALEHRQGDGASARFVDLQRGELQRADFAVVPYSPSPAPRDSAAADSAAIANVRQRLIARNDAPDELPRGIRRELSPTDRAATTEDLRARPASGFIDSEGLVAGEGGVDRVPGAHGGHGLAPSSPAPGVATEGLGDPAAPRLEDALQAADATLGFLGVADGDTLTARQITVRVKAPSDTKPELTVNGVVIPTGRVGRWVSEASRNVTATEYVGIDLTPGRNRIELAPGAGQPIAVSISVLAPGPLARLELSVPDQWPIDAERGVPVRVRALDSRGLPVPERTLVTLETSLGRWRPLDLDPSLPGHQIAVERGEAVVELMTLTVPGIADVSVSAADATIGRGAARIGFLPELRSVFLVGTVEGVLSWRDLRRGGDQARPGSGFEQSLTAFSNHFGDDRGEAAARAALFLKGRVAEGMLLTVGVDTERPRGLRRMRDVQPDQYYPVYGDASLRGYEAQSTGRLYARLDAGGASFLYGDFMTQAGGGARTLSAYSRSLSGIQQRYENRNMRVEAFGSRERGARRVDELPGRGVSGPYELRSTPLVENSEVVEIVTRDRTQPSLVLRVEPRARFLDYAIDPFAGRIVFKAPVPSFDADMNPVSVRVGYAIKDGGPAYWIAGGEARVQPFPGIELGGSYVDDRNLERSYGLRSGFAAVRLGAATVLEGEYATSEQGGGFAGANPAGDGGRVELRHESARAQGRLFGSVTDASFLNPSGGFAPGRMEAGGRWSLRLGARSRLLAEGLFTGQASGAERRGGGMAALDQGITPWLRGEFGVRAARTDAPAAAERPSLLALRTKLTAQLPSRPELSGYGEVEQDVLETSRRLLAVGAEYRFAAQGRLYGRHELISSLTSAYAMHQGERRLATVFGVESAVGRDARAFSEYRLTDALIGRDAEAAMGIRNAWRIEGWRVSSSLERVSPLLGRDEGPSTAVTGAIETTEDGDVKASSRMEVRTGRASDSFLSTLGLAYRIDRAWALLGRGIATVSNERARGIQARLRVQTGMAYRHPDFEDWDALARYELHLDRESDLPLSRRQRLAHVVSAHGTGRMFERFKASAAWAGKVARETAWDVPTRSSAQRFHVRLARDVGKRGDIGLHATTLWSNGFERRRDGVGAEIGRNLWRDVWVSLGWNRFNFQDPDLPDEQWSSEGVYLRLRTKFDETLFAGSGRRP